MANKKRSKPKIIHDRMCRWDRMVIGYCCHDAKTGKRKNPLDAMPYLTASHDA